MWHHVRTLNLGVKTDWNTDRHCALNLKNKYIYKHIKKKKNLSFFFPLSLFLRGRKWEFFFQVFFFSFCFWFEGENRSVREWWGKTKTKKQDAETDGVGGRCEENSIWCQTRNSRRLFSFRVERTALGEVSVGEWKRSGVSACVCLCVNSWDIWQQQKILNWERMTWGKPNVAPRGVVTACVSSSSRLFQVLGSVPGPAPRCSPANRTGWDQSDRTLELLRFQLGENYTVPLSVSEGWRR